MRNHLLISLAAHLVGALVIGAVGAMMHPPLQPVQVLKVDLATLPAPKTENRPARSVPKEKPLVLPPEPKVKPKPLPPAPRPVEKVTPPLEIARRSETEPVTPVEKLPPSPKLQKPAPPPEPKAADDLDFLEPEQVAPEAAEPLPPPAADDTGTKSAHPSSAPAQVEVETHSGLPDYYLALLQRKIDRRWEPSSAGVRGGPSVSCLVRFRIAPSGVIQSPRVVKSSGFSVFDREALRAVISASPLPAPPAGSKVVELPINVRFHLER